MASDEIPDVFDPLAELARGLPQLTTAIENLNRNTGKTMVGLAKSDARTRRVVHWLIVAAFVKVAIIVALLLAVVAIQSNQHRVTALTHRLDIAQTVTRQNSLCPLYQLFLGLKSAEARAASPDPSAYDHAFAVIENGYIALNCAEFATKPVPSASATR